jgi:hypothetical protein
MQHAPLAQRIEREIMKLVVSGSTPLRGNNRRFPMERDNGSVLVAFGTTSLAQRTFGP